MDNLFAKALLQSEVNKARSLENFTDRMAFIWGCAGVSVIALFLVGIWVEYTRAKERPALADAIAANYRECVRENAGALARMQCEVAAFELADAQEPGRLTAAVAERIRAMRDQP